MPGGGEARRWRWGQGLGGGIAARFGQCGGAAADGRNGGEGSGGVARSEVQRFAGGGEGCALERLDEQLAMPAGHRRDDRLVARSGGGEEREARHAVEFRPPADRQAVRSGDGDTQAGEAAGADADEDMRRDRAPSLGEQLVDHRHQPLGMAAADQLVTSADQRAIGGEQRGGAGRRRTVDREEQWPASLDG